MGLFDWIIKRVLGKPSPPPRQRGVVAPARPVPTARPAAPPRQKPPQTLAGLDASQYTPLSQKQVRKEAGQLGNLWGNPWFGRTDLIPPPDDPRTKLIDQAMVGHGLITPDELVEIHRVGLEMDELRPDLAVAHRQAERAVAANREERERIKRQKKAEAAAQRKQHAADVAERRATDIIFLGRGVSMGLADRRANVERLKARDLPVLATPADAAQALGVSVGHLRWLAFHSEASRTTHYACFEVPKKSGGMRQLAAPMPHLANAQQWILDHVLRQVPVHDAAHGFVPGRSTLTNATPHVAGEVVVNTDLTDFFPTVTFPRVKGIFAGLGYSPAVATIFALLCTESPRHLVEYDGEKYHVALGPRRLPQGACTSPALSNLVARNLDARLAGICSKLGWTYTRYADDLSFSASGEATQQIGYLLARVRHIVGDEGFAVNESKTRVQRRSTQQSVTGVVVNERPGVPRKLIRRLRAILHHAQTEGIAAQNRQKHQHFEQWLTGMLAYVQMINPAQAEPLWRLYRSARKD